MDLKLLVRHIVNNPVLHGRWLNTFSYLEYIGFRKIVKSQEGENLTLETLTHAVEEGRHALMLKKLAVKIGGRGMDTYSPATLLCGAEAETYFQTLDSTCARHFTNESPASRTRLTYLYVTWLVEQRALSVYGVYQEALNETGVKISLAGLLAEEDLHLAAVKKELLQSDPELRRREKELQAGEEELFQNYLRALTREILRTEIAVEAIP